MTEELISLDRYFSAVWRAKWFIIIATLLVGGAVAFFELRQPALYTATALIEVGRVWKEPLEDPYATAEIANSAGFIRELAAKTGDKPAHIRRSVRAETINVGPRRSRYPVLIRITATTEKGFDESERLAQAVADEILARHDKMFEEAIAPHRRREARLEERLKQSAAGSDAALKIESEIDQLRANNASPAMTEKTHLADPVAEGSIVKPSPWRRVAAYSLVALLSTAALAILVDLFKSVRRSPD
jgi:uncharacterized protein involved in exopolysaccharide biosynthesis